MKQIWTLITCLILAVSVTSREYTDKEIASFPKLFHLDEYERCLARVDGLYCLGTFELTPATRPHPTYDLMKTYSDESYRHFNRTRIHRGYCLSIRCPLDLVTSDNASLLFERCADHYSQRSELRASLHTLHYCHTHADSIAKGPETNAEHIMKQVLYTLVLANIVGTIYDVFVEDTPTRNKNKLVSAFSIPANWRRLTFIREGGDPRQRALIPMEGVRVMALGFTTYAHATVFHFLCHTTNPELLEVLTQGVYGIFLSDGTSLIQAFMMMSCFLTAYNLLIYSKDLELGIYLLPMCIIKRVIRITPVHLLVVGYASTWWMYSRDGPLVPITIGLESAACRKKFWSHFFFVNNIVDASNYCVAPTWFLPVNMHMYIVACTFTLLLWRRRSFAIRLYAVLFVGSCLMTAVISYVRDYKAMTIIATPEEVHRIFRDTPSFTEFYMSSWGALPACFVGLILAHIQFELDERKIKLADCKWFVWLHYTCFPLLFLWSMTGMFARTNNIALFTAAYIALDRPFYCILMAVGLMGLFHVDAVTAAVTMPGGGGAPPGTPSAKPKVTQNAAEKQRTKVVVALYPFKAIESGDLSLEKGAEYEVIDDSQDHWWKVKDENGLVGYIPSNYVKEKETIGLQKYEWYVGEMSRQRAESLLKQEDKEGCFVVRNSSTKGMYTLSLYTKVYHPQTKHYHIKQNSRSEYYLSDKHCCASIPELINYHKHNSGGLCSRLKTTPCDRPAPPTAGLSHDKWEIDPSELVLLEELGAGQFGVVRRGKWRGRIDTAVKMMKEGTMSEDDFIDEAKVMTKLQHQNLVQLYGVCSKHRPIYIVTEYMRHGSLFNYLRRTSPDQLGPAVLLDMCIQVCKGMAYLERHNYIHRDLAARNCLVGDENVVKVADFGLARYVLDDQYTSSGGTKFPIKWAPPEVLNYTRFSSKSDVWAFGVLMWEVFTCGKVPYGRMKNSEVADMVQRGMLLEKPKGCLNEIYNVMRLCWRRSPEERPSFRVLKEELGVIAHSVLAD